MNLRRARRFVFRQVKVKETEVAALNQAATPDLGANSYEPTLHSDLARSHTKAALQAQALRSLVNWLVPRWPGRRPSGRSFGKCAFDSNNWPHISWFDKGLSRFRIGRADTHRQQDRLHLACTGSSGPELF